jgi:hypothetical protein
MARLIVFILIFVVFLAFIVLNLGNNCDISFGLKTISQVPVFITAFSSFILGMLVAVPLILGKKKQGGPSKLPKPKKGGPDAGIPVPEEIPGGKGF